MKTRSKTFLPEKEVVWERCGDGLRRQIMGYDPHLMTVKVAFDKGAVGMRHAHYHTQSTLIVSGRFEVTVGDETRTLAGGDGYYVEPDLEHGVLCLEEGVLIDIFSPVRADFLK